MPEDEKCQILPPWLWIWFILYLYTFPDQIGLLKENLGAFFFSTDPIYSEITLVNRFKLINAPYWIPSVFLFFGALSVFFPQLRKKNLEKKYNLTDKYQSVPAIIEIENFLKIHAPELRIKANLLSSSEEVFVYPLGYRKTGIAIFGKFIKSWRSDRESAQAVLLHEIGHYRNGDVLILGTGSLFEFVVRHSVSIILFFSLIQIILGLIDITDSSSHNMLIGVFLPINIITDPIIILFQTLAFFTLPIAGIWAAELNADRFMLTSKVNSTSSSLKSMERLRKEKSLKQWLFSQVTHPPNSFRRWMAIHSSEKKTILLYLFLFPIAYVFQLVMLEMYALSSYFITYLFKERNTQEILESLIKNSLLYVNARSLTWFFFSVVIISWPLIAIYWVRFFSRVRETYNIENYKEYLFNASFWICIFGLSCSI